LDFKKAKVYITNVDSQSSVSGGVLVQVLGEMSNNGESCQKFCQTFFLAEQPEGYYVLNNIFRFLKEDIDADYDETEENGVDRAPTFNFQDPAKQASQPVAKPAPVPQKKPSSPVKQEAKPIVKSEEKKTPAPVNKETKPVQPVAPPKPTPVSQPQPTVAPAAQPPTPAPVAQPAQAPPARPPSPKKEVKPAAPLAWSKIAAANTDVKPTTPPQQPKAAPPPVQQTPKPAPQPVQPTVQAPKPVKKEEDESDGFKEITRRQPDRRQASEGTSYSCRQR
jgi:hypothetical protein